MVMSHRLQAVSSECIVAGAPRGLPFLNAENEISVGKMSSLVRIIFIFLLPLIMEAARSGERIPFRDSRLLF